MHDLKALRADPEAFVLQMARRGVAADAVADLMELDAARRRTEGEAQSLQTRRNEIARLVGAARRAGTDANGAVAEGREVSDRLATLEAEATTAAAALMAMASSLPNVARANVPEGADENANVVMKTVGECRMMPWAAPHWEFGQALGLDIPAGVDLAGTRFAVLRGGMARLERALGQFMLDLHVDEHGYEETAVPHLVRRDILFGTGQLPKFEDDLFRAGDLFLVPTAEVPLTNLARERALDPASLPMRLAALTPCFRAEVGASGRDVRGIMRQHQFAKVELVSVVLPEDADAEHERLTRAAETVLERLGLAYRRVVLCTGDTGFSAARTFDLEVWMPGQAAWREISSCSTCGDFQARRMGTRIKGRKDLPHTLNGSGVAVGRAMAAILENFVREDGSVALPCVLAPYMRGDGILHPR